MRAPAAPGDRGRRPAAGRHRLQQRRAVGEALRARSTSPTRHVGRARPGLGCVPQPRLRGARRRARRHRQPRRRLRLQLRTRTMSDVGADSRRCSASPLPPLLAARGRTRGRAAGRPRRRALPPLRRRRRHDRRPVAAGAQEVRREVLGLGQLLRRHGVERVHRRDDDGQPLQRRAHAGQPRRSTCCRARRSTASSYTQSDENDYTANTASFDISQDVFGDLTTVSLGFSQGWDEVRKRGDAAFEETVDRRNYRLGLSADRDAAT